MGVSPSGDTLIFISLPRFKKIYSLILYQIQNEKLIFKLWQFLH